MSFQVFCDWCEARILVLLPGQVLISGVAHDITVHGQTYHFCSSGCQQAYIKEYVFERQIVMTH